MEGRGGEGRGGEGGGREEGRGAGSHYVTLRLHVVMQRLVQTKNIRIYISLETAANAKEPLLLDYSLRVMLRLTSL